MAKDMMFLVKRNSDLTEGRGGMITVGVYNTFPAAVAASKGLGVMGVGDGEVWSLELPEFQAVVGKYGEAVKFNGERKAYGYHHRELPGRKSEWVHDYVFGHPAVIEAGILPPEEDPEYREYLRLKEKFRSGR